MKKSLSEMTLEELWQIFPIILKDHNPKYKEWYETEKNLIEKEVHSNMIKRISHIGSSAVEGLISKPTVDILLEVDKSCDIEQLKSVLGSSGWILMVVNNEPDFKMSFSKGYTPEGFAKKVYHLHVRFLGDCNELYFRDYLIAHKDIANEYAKLKQKLALEHKHNRDAYTDAKSDFIVKYTDIAKREFKDIYKLD